MTTWLEICNLISDTTQQMKEKKIIMYYLHMKKIHMHKPSDAVA